MEIEKDPMNKRNDKGLLPEINYQYNPDGTINWRKMIKPDFLVPNEEKLSASEIEEINSGKIKIDQLRDDQVLILLGGIKELAFLRGLISVDHTVVTASREYICVKCSILWSANFETNGVCVMFSALADAHSENTNRMGYDFLASIAENRAFVRAVRNFLRINIVGKDEMKNRREAGSAVTPMTQATESSGEGKQALNEYGFLQDLMTKKGVTFEKVKARLVRENVDGADTISKIEDIPSPEVFKLIAALKKFK